MYSSKIHLHIRKAISSLVICSLTSLLLVIFTVGSVHAQLDSTSELLASNTAPVVETASEYNLPSLELNNYVLDEEEICCTWDDIAEETKTFGPNFFLGEYQFDSRGFNTIHFMGSAALPYGFNLWGFVDLEGLDDSNARREDIRRVFIELDLKRKIGENWGIIAELNDSHGTNNALGRLGIFVKPSWQWLKDNDMFLFFKIFGYETDGHGGQASFAWNKKFPCILDGRFSAGGFFDANFNTGAGNAQTKIVSDTQIRYRLIDGLHLLMEFRYNQFLGSQNDFGIGSGIQYRF